MWSAADSQADSPESEWAVVVIPADAAAGCAAVMSLGAPAAAVVHVAEVAPVAAKGLEAASAAAGNCEPVGNPHSTRKLHYVHMYLFFPAHTTIRARNLVDDGEKKYKAGSDDLKIVCGSQDKTVV